MDLKTVFSQNKKCPVREIGEGLVILAPSGDTTHSLEDIGAFIWNQIDGQKDLQGVLDAILDAYDVENDTAKDDLFQFVSQMQTTGLILEM
ncbi:MAG: PqqD family protein [bacterium]|nr:PqqD family protein [bacterium]